MLRKLFVSLLAIATISSTTTVLTVLIYAAVMASPAIASTSTNKEIAIVAVAISNKKATVEETYKALLKALPNESKAYLYEIAEWVHRSKAKSST